MPIEPYFTDGEGIELYLGDCREVVPELGITADLVLADPPYAETSQAWDRWPAGWLTTAATITTSLWCFGSQRMFFAHLPEFQTADWDLSQDVISHDDTGQPVTADVNVIWEKHAGTGFATDRFKRVHEHVLLWYHGPWKATRHVVPRVPAQYDAKGRTQSRSAVEVPHTGAIGAHHYVDDGTRLMRSVIKAKSVRGQRRHPDEKPLDILSPLIEYSCPPGGLVVDPFAGSGSTLDAARRCGRRAIGVEAHEPYIEAAAKRLQQTVLFA